MRLDWRSGLGRRRLSSVTGCDPPGLGCGVRGEMECSFEVLNLRKPPLVARASNNVCTQIVVSRYQYQLSLVIYRKITDPGDFLSERIYLNSLLA